MEVRTIADLVDALLEEERRVLDDEPLAHGPTIGGMYEGLTREVLDLSLVDHAPIVVAPGFIRYAEDHMSRQLDCVVALKTTRKAPYTDARYFAPQDVVAVIEVKKSGTKRDLCEGVEQLLPLADVKCGPEGTSMIDDHFAYMSGHIPDAPSKLSVFQVSLYKWLACCLYNPLRIVWGLGGYARHSNFRKYLPHALAVDGATIHNIPSLIISGRHVALLEDGLPWSTCRVSDMWPVISTHVGIPPLYFVLEAILTRLRLIAGANDMIHGDSLCVPRLRPLLRMKDQDSTMVPEMVKDSLPPSGGPEDDLSWTPVTLDDATDDFSHFTFLHTPEIRKLMMSIVEEHPATEEAAKIQASLDNLFEKRLVVRSLAEPGRYRPMSPDNAMVMLPGHTEMVVTDPKSFRLFRWVRQSAQSKDAAD